MQIPELRRLFLYDHWANIEVANALRGTADPPRKAVAIFAHIAAAERLWLARIHRERSAAVVWPALSVDESTRQLGELHVLWLRYLDTLGEPNLAATINYSNSQGEPFTSTVGEILTHVVMHSAYHRAQIALNMRESGHTPPNTDFIHAIRNGLVE